MNILINDIPHTLPPEAKLADALRLVNATPPFAAAVNRRFVPRSRRRSTRRAGPAVW